MSSKVTYLEREVNGKIIYGWLEKHGNFGYWVIGPFVKEMK